MTKTKSQRNPKFQAPNDALRQGLGFGVWSFIGIWILVLGMFATGCATHSHQAPTSQAAAQTVWPQPPDPPRIRYVQSVSKPSDLGARQSALMRFGRWLTGSEKGNEQLIKPFGVAVDEADNLCITDTGANVVCFYDRVKKNWKRWEKAGAVRFSSPVAVAKRLGTFYVADSGLGSVIVFDEQGRLKAQITNHLERPSGIAIGNGKLLVADSQRHRIVTFGLDGSYQGEFGKRGVGPGEFNFPTHLAPNENGEVFVTDSMNSRVQILGASGQSRGQIGNLGDSPGHFNRPKGVAIDSFGHIYVVDALFDNVQVFDRTGRLLLDWGEAGSLPGQFWLPNGIAISGQNEIYISDSYNRRIQIFKYVGAE